MKATLIGTIEGGAFSQGVSLFPVLDNPVHLASAADLDTIFDRRKGKEVETPDPEAPGFCIALGESAVFGGCPIMIDPDAFFGKHAAVLGSTGSGKSCTIASLIQSILERSEIRRTHFVILDTNGEYRSAFQRQKKDGSWEDIGRHRCLYIPSDPGARSERLVIPYWFLNQGLIARLKCTDVQQALDDLASRYQVDKDSIVAALTAVKDEAEAHIDNNTYPKVLPANARNKIRNAIDPIYSKLTGSALGEGTSPSGVSADTPAYFDKCRFRSRHIEQVLRREESGGARARDFSGTMLLRIDRLLADSRFEFLMGPTGRTFPQAQHTLATFLRDVLGLPSESELEPPLSDESSVPKGLLPFYDRQRTGSEGHHVVIVDLSLLAAEVLENVTALIGRLLLEFLQRLGEHGGASARGSLPVVLVLEEAQNYVCEQRYGDEESISRTVFERIAREGRKHGLALLVASQRPSELSKTVLSQCSSFIVHRLQNPEDLRYFKEIVPGIYGPLLDQLPALAPQTVLVLGECVRAPALVRIREANPLPRSRDPKFYKHWVEEKAPNPPVEAVCARWEGKENGEGGGDTTGSPDTPQPDGTEDGGKENGGD